MTFFEFNSICLYLSHTRQKHYPSKFTPILSTRLNDKQGPGGVVKQDGDTGCPRGGLEGAARSICPGTGGKSLPGERIVLPHALECARIRLLICLAPGRVPHAVGMGPTEVWVGRTSGMALDARKGYLTELGENAQAATHAGRVLWSRWNVPSQVSYNEPGQSWFRKRSLCRCMVCENDCTYLIWAGPGRERPLKCPPEYTAKDRDPLHDQCPFGPREGPRGCRVLICQKCYSLFGPRIVIAAYPDRNLFTECYCTWRGYELVTCSIHQHVRVQSGIYLQKGEGVLQEGNLPERKRAISPGGFAFKGSMENLAQVTLTALEKMHQCCLSSFYQVLH